VTDDQGRYLVPDLPQADYSVWVRGYALVDSPKMRAKPGQRLNLAAASAPSAADAAHYYPAIYWYSLLTIPDKKEFAGRFDDGILDQVGDPFGDLRIDYRPHRHALGHQVTFVQPPLPDALDLREQVLPGDRPRP
jgi:hypothetical protein